MTHNRRAQICLLALAVLTTRAWAQPTSVMDGASEPLPRYHVEVIVFAHSDGDLNEEWFDHTRDKARRDGQFATAVPTPRIVGSANEITDGGAAIVLDGLSVDEMARLSADDVADDVTPADPLNPAPPPPELADQPPDAIPADVSDDLDVEVKYRAPDGAGFKSFRFRVLRDDELQLNDAYSRMVRLGAYEPLLHGGWVQEGLAEDQARPLDLSYLGTRNPSGTIQLHLSRFLHVTLDLNFRHAAAGVAPGFVDNPFELSEMPLQTRYSLVDQRRVRSGELHYIDHPLFGVLVLVTPAPQAEEDVDSSNVGQTPAA